LVVLVVIGAVVASQSYWLDLRGSMARMDQTLEHARQRQQAMISQFSEAQSLLLAQQRHLQEIEATLRERESALAERHAAVEAALARAQETKRTQQELREQGEARRLARMLERGIAGLAEPDVDPALSDSLEDLSAWVVGADMVSGSPLRPDLLHALAETRDQLDAIRAQGPVRLAERLRELRRQALDLPPDARALVPWGPRRATDQGDAGQLTAQLDTALLAVSRGDQTLLALALDTASAWLGAFYDTTRGDVTDLAAQLNDLRRLPVTQDLARVQAAAAHLRAVLGEIIMSAGTAKAADQPDSVPDGG
jgi:hypothetical protein